jgi:hypothetical protein
MSCPPLDRHDPARGPSVPTRVHAPERPQRRPAINECGGEYSEQVAAVFRHSGWAESRRRVTQALKATGQTVARIQAFDGCGFGAFLCRKIDEPDRYRVMGSACRDRFCLPCQRDRSRIVGQNVVQFLKHTPVRFLTLTLKHSNDPLADQLHRLYVCLRTLRRRPVWTANVVGGAAFLEVTLEDDGRWHPHYHVLLQGKYMPKAEIRRAWHDITGDSYVIDIRMAGGDRDVVRYVSKYASKPFSGEISRRFDKLCELVRAMKGRRTIVAFGHWRRLTATSEETCHGWDYVCTLTELVERARTQAGEWLDILRTVRPEGYEALLAILPDQPSRAPPLPEHQPDDQRQQTMFTEFQVSPRF